MHATDKNTEEDSLTEAFTKYAERATRAEANMAEMEAKLEERFRNALYDRTAAADIHTTTTTISGKPPAYADCIFHNTTPTIHTTNCNYPRPLPTTTATI